MKRYITSERDFLEKIADVDSKTLERYFSRITPKSGLQRVCYSLSPVWKNKKRVIRDVLSERYSKYL